VKNFYKLRVSKVKDAIANPYLSGAACAMVNNRVYYGLSGSLCEVLRVALLRFDKVH
jgi:hypothetical protein